MTLEGGAHWHRVLVIDDQAEIHESFRKILAARDRAPSLLLAKAALFGSAATAAPARPSFDLHFALQGQEGARAVEAARRTGTPFQVAFVDMRMPPGWDGLTTIRELWKLDPALQVVICTAYSDVPLEAVTQEFGANSRLLILKKPFDVPEILQLATTLCEKWRAEREASAKLDELEQRVQQRTQEIEHAMLHDRLTDLPNRTLLLERLDACLARYRRDPSRRYAVLFLDFDGFKLVNDAFGHEVGDLVLIEIARRLSESLRSTDLVSSGGTPSRLGGDEFVVLLEDLRETRDAAHVAERLLEALAVPFTVGEHELVVGASIGITTSEGAYESAADAIRDADTAMYRAKAAARGRYVLFDKVMHEAVMKRLELERALRLAIRDQALHQHYQPIIRIADGALIGFEALVRWHDPRFGDVPATDLITVAEETGLIQSLGLLMFEVACRQLRVWQERHPIARELKMSVNLSRRQLLAADFTERILKTLRETGVAATSLILEITESSVFHDLEGAATVLRRLRDLGAEIHLDDFGSGYSSLSHLSRLPLTAMKLDRSLLVQASGPTGQVRAFAAVLDLARAYGISLVAEGVETEDQLALLRRLEVDHAQGYLLGRPLSAEDSEAVIVRSFGPDAGN